ncbi:aspartate/glutamate racemase family protein [Caballeronia sp. GACF5]|uniref:aspartate/glutamate racemase family protein n=1 Tax=Caballeronia sp. GACF5 TaxID=2921746 RepID=UPI002028F374|nr:aspartate/glutamate racemase family protein [Caballeronia sp. GACF5]
MKTYRVRPGAQSYGHDIGIIMMYCTCPFPPGDVGNAYSYEYPVLFRTVHGVTIDGLLNRGDRSHVSEVIAVARSLEQEGVKAITSDCGYMLEYQEEVAAAVNIPVMLSSLLQLPFIASILGPQQEIGIICANSEGLSDRLLSRAYPERTRRVHIVGMQDQPAFRQAILDEQGILDFESVEAETVAVARSLIEKHPAIGALLLECSDLPQYSHAVQQAVKLPVFDFLTMIDYVRSACARKPYTGGY